MSVLKSEITDRNIPSVDKFIKALKYLNTGQELEIEGYVFKVAETFTEDCFGIVQVVKQTNTQNDEVKEVVLGMPIDFFIRKCFSLTDEQLTIMSANMTLNQINKRR